MATTHGETDPLEQAPRRTWTRSGGWATIRTWLGDKAGCESLAAKLTNEVGPEAMDLSSDDNVNYRLEVTYPDGQDTALNLGAGDSNVTWELIGNSLNKDLKTHSSISPTDATDRADLACAEEWARSPSLAGANAAAIAKKVATLSAKAQKLYQHLSKGTQGYEIASYVIRKTIKLGYSQAVKASLSNVNKVEEPTKCDTTFFEIPTQQGDSTIEWLKRPPTVTQVGRGKYYIIQEWWGATKWSSDLYGGTAKP